MANPHPCPSGNLLLSFSINSTWVRSPGTVSGVLAEKGGLVNFFGLHSIFAILEPSGNGLPLPGTPPLVGGDHHRIGNDEPDHVCGVGLTGPDSLPIFVSFELRECKAAGNFQGVLVL